MEYKKLFLLDVSAQLTELCSYLKFHVTVSRKISESLKCLTDLSQKVVSIR